MLTTAISTKIRWMNWERDADRPKVHDLVRRSLDSE